MYRVVQKAILGFQRLPEWAKLGRGGFLLGVLVHPKSRAKLIETWSCVRRAAEECQPGVFAAIAEVANLNRNCERALVGLAHLDDGPDFPNFEDPSKVPLLPRPIPAEKAFDHSTHGLEIEIAGEGEVFTARCSNRNLHYLLPYDILHFLQSGRQGHACNRDSSSTENYTSSGGAI